MTDETTDPRDELASAHLDGATTPAEAEAVAGDPELAERVAVFAAVRDAVQADAGPVDAGRREAAIAAAIAAYDEAGARVTPIAGRRLTTPRWLPAVGVAAAALLLALLIPLLTRDDGDDGDSTVALEAATTTTVAPSGAAADRSSEESAAAPAAGGDTGAMTLAALPETVDLGDQADFDALVAAVRARLESPPTTVPGSPAPTVPIDAEACFDGLRSAASDAGAAVLLQATAVVDGTPVATVARQQADGTRVLAVVALDGCTPFAIVPL
jgi:hypothetical protein